MKTDMNETRLEALSALLDGEAEGTPGDALAELLREPLARRAWGRYHLISDCIRGQLPARIDPELAARIARRLRDEPTVLAPAAGRQNWMRPLAGLAVAASVAAMAILGVRGGFGTGPGEPATQLAASMQAPGAGAGQFHFAAGSSARGPARARPSTGRMNARLNRYLVNYNEYRNNAAVQGMIPYVRIVAHDEAQ